MEEYLNSVQVIKETDKKINIEKPTKKTVLFCLNGFQNSDVHDAVDMMDYFSSSFKEEFSVCEVVPVSLFIPADKKTHYHKLFEKKIAAAIVDYAARGYDIVLMGYSFSCALACKMEKKYRKFIKKLILVAPVYDTVINGMIPHYINYAWKFHKLCKRYGSRAANAIGRKTTKGLFGLLISIFSSILLNRHYFRKVTTDTLLIRGDDDLLCNEHSIKKISHILKGNHVLYRYPNMTHGILKSLKQNGIVYEDILHFSFGTPFLLQKKTLNVEKNKTSKVKYDEDGERIPTFMEIFSEIDPNADEETIQEQEGI
ncbi:MAG: hypothetical protein WCR67_03425 [Bacilli bacterium]